MKTYDIKYRIIEFFFTNPTKRLRVRELERELKAPLPSVIRYVKELINEGLLKVIKISNVTFYTADRSSKKFILLKRLRNIRKIYDSGLNDFLINELGNPVIILFGSFFKGDDIEDSDIDLFIQSELNKKINLNKFEQLLNRRIQLFIHKNIKDVKNTDLMNNIINGFTINGLLEVF